jgi:hypothetical protein
MSVQATAEKTPIVECLAATKERILPLLTRQAYSMHVTTYINLGSEMLL